MMLRRSEPQLATGPDRQLTVAGFTLIEMLLVMLIIVILAGLLLGGINLAIRKAELHQAKTTAQQLATALRSYQSEYGTWPTGLPARGSTTEALIRVLSGEDTASNPRRQVYYEPQAKRLRNGQYRDPWDAAYEYLWDSNYVGSVTINGQRVPSPVLVWSYGSKGGASPTNEWVRTW